MKLKPYPEYKDSGFEWIDEIPYEWEITNLKKNLHIQGVSVSPERIKQEDTIFHYSIPNFDEYGTCNEEKSDSVDSNKYLINKELILILKLNPRKSRVLLVNKQLNKLTICSTEFIPLEYHNINNKYVVYLLSSELFRQTLDSKTNSATQSHKRVNPNVITRLRAAIPSIKEQNQIVCYLDKKTSKIDKTIQKDTQLIELLKEKRTALINHAVTKGLDPDVKMKDSWVEWIGEIPEGWELRRLKYNCLVNPSEKKILSDPRVKVNFLPMEKVSEDGEYDLGSKTEYENVSSGYTYFENNDVLLAKITPCFENGKGALVKNLKHGFGFGTTEFHVLRFGNNIYPKYLYFLTKSHLFRVIGEAFMEGAAGQKRISTDFVKDFPMPTPPLIQQKEITLYLNSETSKIDETVKKIERKIELLEEYKKSLIHHVVTGKVDVREEVVV